MSAWIYTVICLHWLTICPPDWRYNVSGLYETKQQCVEAGMEELKKQHRDWAFAVKCDEVHLASGEREEKR